MRGYQITFFTQQSQKHAHQPVADWLVHTAMELGLRGATVAAASAGFGQHHHLHSAHFFELADQPQMITMVVSEDEAAQLFQRLDALSCEVFFVKTAVEFGAVGGPA